MHGHVSLISSVVDKSETVFISGCVNLSFAYVEGESLLMALKDVALSSGRSVTLVVNHQIFVSKHVRFGVQHVSYYITWK